MEIFPLLSNKIFF